jgi:hypothetical protein
MKKLTAYFHIVLYFSKMTINDIIKLAMGIKTMGDPDVTFVSYTDAQLKTLAQTVLTDLGSRVTDPHPTLTHQQEIDVNALCVAIMAVKGDVERQANAKAKGDRSAFDIIVNRIGMHGSKPHNKHTRIAEFLPSEKGCFCFRVPAEGIKGEDVIYIYEFGVTNTYGVIPASWENAIALQYVELTMSGLPSGTVIGMRYAAQLASLTGKRGTKTTTSGAATAKSIVTPSSIAVRLPINKEGKVSLVYKTSYLHFSDVMYFRIP